MAKRVVLAYSGGLDTSVAVKWIQEEWGAEVIALAVDVGQTADDPWDVITARALAAGAVEAKVVDARAEFADDFLVPAIHANALYEGKYPLVSALSRPVISRHLALAAREFGADAVAHGCTGKGNDQVRFEVSVRALAPDLEVLAPVRVWGFTREDSVDYALKHDIPINVNKKSIYSIDENLWGRAIECGILEDPWVSPPSDAYALTRDPADAPREPRELVVRLRAGRAGRARRCLDAPCTSSCLRSDRPSASTGSAASTWSRTAGWASRAARPTSARDRSRCCSRTPTSSRSRRSATSCGRRHGSSRGTRSSCTTACGTRRSRRRSTRSWPTPRSSSPARCACTSSRAGASSRDAGPIVRLYSYELATYDAADTFHHEDSAGLRAAVGPRVETWAREQGGPAGS